MNYVSPGADFLSRRAGDLIRSGNSLDFAIQGDGWFGIQTPSGAAYTWDGRARLDESGVLRTLNGNPSLDAGGAPILINPVAHATRDLALAAGEAAVARGYAPSVFSDLPRLLEGAGPGVEGSGSITGIFSVLVDGDDHNDPVADAVRGALDGHIELRLMGGYTPGADPALSKAIRSAPRIYEAMRQAPDAPRSEDPVYRARGSVAQRPQGRRMTEQ